MSTRPITIESLSDLVEQDKEDHLIKQLAHHFIQAMSDWPARDQEQISDFLQDLKCYFGNPITLDRLHEKKNDTHTQHYWWKREAGAAIIKLLQLSEQKYEHPSLEQVIEDILDYYGE